MTLAGGAVADLRTLALLCYRRVADAHCARTAVIAVPCMASYCASVVVVRGSGASAVGDGCGTAYRPLPRCRGSATRLSCLCCTAVVDAGSVTALRLRPLSRHHRNIKLQVRQWRRVHGECSALALAWQAFTRP